MDLSRVFHHNVILAWCWCWVLLPRLAGWLSGPLPLWPCYMAGGGGSWEILYEHTGFSANHRHVLLKFGWNYVEFLFTS